MEHFKVDTIVSNKHLTSILEVIIIRHLRNNWFEIKRMRTTVSTGVPFSPSSKSERLGTWLAGTRKNVQIIESLDNSSCLSAHAYTQGPSQSVWLIE